ncbi:putative F-box associated interaction domain-containing protein [Medicago truncatula]|uniref:Putative F-box associated interaction domain-containing protein n=1 Tax=Medicago truncatula TaxID=3880 RepID=A0A396J8F3_MEDTR|nr:putative F-box associated interaction domain-containing protein [Medicago truncatula]
MAFSVSNSITCFPVLWNPSIMKFAKFPSLEIQGSNTIYSGFGYDHHSKVVAFSGVYQVQTYVHTMGTNFWTRIQDFPQHESGKFINGTLNWLACNNSTIVSLDLEKGSYRKLLLPDI